MMRINKKKISIFIFAFMLTIGCLFSCIICLNNRITSTASEDNPFVLVSLGDSVASGGYIVSNTTISSYTESIYSLYETTFGTTIFHREAIENFDSAQLLTRLENETLKTKLASADVVLLSIGLNDFYSIVTNNYSSFINGTVTEATLRTLLQTATSNFETNFNAISKKLCSLTKSSVVVSVMTVFNPFRGVTSRQLGSIVDEYVVIMNEVISGLSSPKFEIVDVKTEFNALDSTSFQALFSGILPYIKLDNEGQTAVANIHTAQMKVLEEGFTYSICLSHFGELVQTFTLESEIVFTLSAFDGVVIGTSPSWYVDDVLYQQSEQNTFAFTPFSEGSFVIKAIIDGYEAIETVSVNYVEITSLSLDFQGLLFQTLEFAEPVTFSIVVPVGCNPNTTVEWFVDSLQVQGSPDSFSCIFMPDEIGEFVVRAQIGNLYAEKTVRVDYAVVSDFSLTNAGSLEQHWGAISTVDFLVTLPEYCDPIATVEWSIDDTVQTEISNQFSFLPSEIGSYVIKAKIGNVEKTKEVFVTFATVQSFTLSSEGTLAQYLNYITPVSFAFTLPEFSDPATLAEWKVNFITRARAKTFIFTPTNVGTYVVEAKIGNVSRTVTITVDYIEANLAGKSLGYNGTLTQYGADLQPILFSIEISQFADSNQVKWYVDNVEMQTVGREFWFVPTQKYAEGVTRFLIYAKVDGEEPCNTIIVSVFSEGNTSLDFYGIIFLTAAGFVFILFVFFIITKIRNARTII